MAVNENIRMQNIEEMISLLEEMREKKKAIFPGAEYFDTVKADIYKGLIEWINAFAKKLNIELMVTIRTEVPKTRIRFYQTKPDDEDTPVNKTFEFIVGSPDKLKRFDYYDLTQGVFLDYKQNDKQISNGKYYDSILNIIVWLADNAPSIKSSIQDAAERELFKKLTEEEKELEKMIKIVKNR